MGNYRCRQLEKCYYRLQKRPDWLATLKTDHPHALQMIFIPYDELEAYKEKYGDRLNVWFEEEKKRWLARE